MRAWISFGLGTLLAVLMIAAPIAYKRWHDREYRNFHVVEDGVLYRSGQLPLPRLQKIVYDHGIRTVVSLRDNDKPTDQDEEAWLKGKGLKFVRIPYRSWWPNEKGVVPADESVKMFRDVMADPANHPVLVHCFAGIHRTGTMCAIFRMDFEGWTNEQAMNEMRVMGYTILEEHEDIFMYVARYRPPPRERPLHALPAAFKKNTHP
jgi:protein tyrosine/serine phosphatase